MFPPEYLDLYVVAPPGLSVAISLAFLMAYGTGLGPLGGNQVKMQPRFEHGCKGSVAGERQHDKCELTGYG